MRLFVCSSIVLFASTVFAVPRESCLHGNFSACREIFNKYGSQSDRSGAVELFEEACAAQSLSVTCIVTTVDPSKAVKKTMELYKPGSGLFVINGTKSDKIYQIVETK